MEKEMTGVYISGHPLDQVADLLDTGFTTVADVFSMTENEHNGMDYDGNAVTMAGILALAKSRITKKGAMMGIITLEDLTGQLEGLVFPKIYDQFVDQLQTDQLVILGGKLSFREEEEPKLLVDTVQALTAQTAASVKLNQSIAVAQKAIGTTPAWNHDPQKKYARLSEDNLKTVLSYPAATEEVEVDETLFHIAPLTL